MSRKTDLVAQYATLHADTPRWKIERMTVPQLEALLGDAAPAPVVVDLEAEVEAAETLSEDALEALLDDETTEMWGPNGEDVDGPGDDEEDEAPVLSFERETYDAPVARDDMERLTDTNVEETLAPVITLGAGELVKQSKFEAILTPAEKADWLTLNGTVNRSRYLKLRMQGRTHGQAMTEAPARRAKGEAARQEQARTEWATNPESETYQSM